MAEKLAIKITGLLILLTVFTISATAILLKKLDAEEAQHQTAYYSHIEATLVDKPRVIRDFRLAATTGKEFNKQNLVGHWTLMFFGFTNCEYVCPTTLAGLSQMYIALQKQLSPEQMPQVVMVTVDPQRDSVQRMQNYLRRFNKNFIGISGDIQQTKLLADQMSVVFTKVVMADGNYMMNHSTEIMLVDPQGKLRAFLPFPHKGPQMVRDYVAMINTLPTA